MKYKFILMWITAVIIFGAMVEPTQLAAQQCVPFVPNDPLFENQWYHLNTGQGGGTAGADAHTACAWAIPPGSKDTIIAIVDPRGFDTKHEDLVDNLWKNPDNTGVDIGWNFEGCTPDKILPKGTPNCGGPINDPSLLGNHGTLVAGVAAAVGNNKLGISGACPNCKIMLLTTGTGPNADDQVSSAFKYAQLHGAKIISNSWGRMIIV